MAALGSPVSVDQRFVTALDAWFKEELDAFKVSGPGLLMGIPLWGKKFINRFGMACAPTMLSPGNAEAFRQNNVSMVVYTDRPGLEELAPARLIPPAIMERVQHGSNKYWLLGAIQNLCIQAAGKAGMGFHMLMPDHLYAENYFPNLFRLAKIHEAIVQTGISGLWNECILELDRYRQDNALIVPDRILGDMAWRHLHPQMQPNLMNDADLDSSMPESHYHLWQGRDFLRIYCCHANLAYLSPKLCAAAPVMRFSPIDTRLPYLVPGEFYSPKQDDGLTFIELSDDAKPYVRGNVDFEQFALNCWARMGAKSDYMRFAAAASEVPIAEQPLWLESEEIDARQRRIEAGLWANQASAKAVIDEARRLRA